MATANLTDDEIALVRDELTNDPTAKGYAATDAAGKARLLAERPTSSVTQAVPKPMDTDAMMSHLSLTSIQSISEVGFDAVGRHIAADSRDAVKRWLKIARVKGQMTQAEHDAVVAEVDATVNETTTTLGDSRLMAVTGRAIGGISAEEVNEVLG